MTNLSGANLNNGEAVGPQGDGMESSSSFSAYSAYKDSGVDWLGAIPFAWGTCSLWMKFQLGRGRVISNEEIQDNLGPYPVYSSQTFNDGVMGAIDTFDFDGDYITWTTDGANAGTVFTRSGRFNCTNVCGTLKATSPNSVNLRFYTYALSVATGWFVRHDINPKLMNNVMAAIHIPSLELMEQRSIARFLDHETARIDALIEEQQRLIELLKEKRQAVISQAVTKGLDPTVPMKDSGVEWLGEVPAHWEVIRYKLALRVFQGMAFKSSDYVEYSDVVSLRMGNIKKGGSIDLDHNLKYLPNSFSSEYDAYALREGDVVIAMTDMSPSLDFLAVPATIKNSREGVFYLLNQRVGKLIFLPGVEAQFIT